MTTSTRQLELLGGFNVRIDGRPVSLPATAAKVVALLALNERPMPRVQVAGTFWPELGDPRALANLRAVIWRLPRGVQPMIAATATTLAIADDVDVDLDSARRLVRDVLDRDVSADAGPAAVALLCRPLLPEWGEDWLVFERERLRQLHIHALERLGQRYLDRGDPLSAVDVGVAVVNAEPLRESAHALVIRAHLAAGNRLDARRCYGRYREVLRRELGLEPTLGLVEDPEDAMS